MMTLMTLPPAAIFPRPCLAIRPGEGVNPLTKPTQSFTVGIVTIKECQSPKLAREYYELRYLDPDTGKEVRRRVRGLDREEIKAMASHLTRMAYQGKGYLKEQSKTITVAEGISQALALTNTLKGTREERIRRAKKFVIWLGENYPSVKGWDQLKPAMLQAYILHRERGGKGFNTVRLDLAPLRLAWRYMVDNYPGMVRPLPRLKIKALPRQEIECLDAGELARLLDWLKEHKPDLWPMACLQGLAGLRLLEAAALRIQDVDLKRGLVTITKTVGHIPKTEMSYRTIPVCGEVANALRAAAAGQKIRPATGELFTNEDGNLWVQTALSHRWSYTLGRAAHDLFQHDPKADKLSDDQVKALAEAKARFLALPARKLRAAFATLAGRLGAPDRLLKAYIGHSSGDVLGGHYRKIELNELRAVSDVIDGWHQGAAKTEVRKEYGNIGLSEIAER